MTGNIGSLDKLNNIYDMLGGSGDWTAEAISNYLCMMRGGNRENFAGYTAKTGVKPYGDSDYRGSRVTIYH